MASKSRGGFFSYLTGFVWSLALTLAAYFTVIAEWWLPQTTIAVIIGLALVQLLVQLFFFLHLGQEKKPKFNLLIFLFMLIVVVILVAGSLWIMHSLDYNMTHTDIDHNLMRQEGIYR